MGAQGQVGVFLACKTTQRKAEGAAAELKESLKRLRTDHLDLYQLHGISDVKKDVDAVFTRGGAMEVFPQTSVLEQDLIISHCMLSKGLVVAEDLLGGAV